MNVLMKFGESAVSELITTLTLWCLSRYLELNAMEQTFMCPNCLFTPALLQLSHIFKHLKDYQNGYAATI